MSYTLNILSLNSQYLMIPQPSHNLPKPHPPSSSYLIFISYTLSYTYSYTYYNYLDIKKILFG